ncbi:DUF2867 domain-containing protein [Vibrio amylolyticus]|uniref:DUF2867 domain-containing protein n=1 Tax=Vibrio amylolyticus TaxID=2847292 RepID=UPI00354B5A8F
MNIPNDTQLYSSLNTAYFADRFSTVIQYHGQSALAVYSEVAKNTPNWVIKLMALRNWIVSKLGLKHLGQMHEFDHDKPSQDYKPGDPIGIFRVVSNTEREMIVEDRDKHLDVRISFLIEPNGNQATVHATTVVHVNNFLGKIYMFFVGPVHKIIVPSSLKQLKASYQ